MFTVHACCCFRQRVVDTVEVCPDGKYPDAILAAWFAVHLEVPQSHGPSDVLVLVDMADVRHRELNVCALV